MNIPTSNEISQLAYEYGIEQVKMYKIRCERVLARIEKFNGFSKGQTDFSKQSKCHKVPRWYALGNTSDGMLRFTAIEHFQYKRVSGFYRIKSVKNRYT